MQILFSNFQNNCIVTTALILKIRQAYPPAITQSGRILFNSTQSNCDWCHTSRKDATLTPNKYSLVYVLICVAFIWEAVGVIVAEYSVPSYDDVMTSKHFEFYCHFCKGNPPVIGACLSQRARLNWLWFQTWLRCTVRRLLQSYHVL